MKGDEKLINSKKRMTGEEIAFNVLGYTYLVFFALVCLLPFLFIIVGSFSNEHDVVVNGFKFFPERISFEAYKLLFKAPKQIINAYTVTIIITIIGTIAGVFFTAMTGYVLSRKKFKHRRKFSFYFYFTTLFSGGMIPNYILITRYLGWRNNIIVLIVPTILSVFYILMMRNFCSGIPDEIEESGRIDGANDFMIFAKLYIPILGPAIASIGLFIALGYWNEWHKAMLYIDNNKLYPLQYLLTRMNNNINYAANVVGDSGMPIIDLPQNTFRMAMVVITIGPIVAFYPFAQRYLIKGNTSGAVKG